MSQRSSAPKGLDAPSGNPYAFIDDEKEARLEAEASKRAASQLALGLYQTEAQQPAARVDPLPRVLFPAGPFPVHPSGNPYAKLSILDEDLALEAQAATATASDIETESLSVPPSGLSQLAFRQLCTAIFRRYIPSLEQGKLRPHHREFIARNESQPPQIRRMLVAALQKYDLGSTPGLAPQFNRESNGFTEAKLKNIEETVLRSEGK
jgi:hypothetical protein